MCVCLVCLVYVLLVGGGAGSSVLYVWLLGTVRVLLKLQVAVATPLEGGCVVAACGECVLREGGCVCWQGRSVDSLQWVSASHSCLHSSMCGSDPVTHHVLLLCALCACRAVWGGVLASRRQRRGHAARCAAGSPAAGLAPPLYSRQHRVKLSSCSGQAVTQQVWFCLPPYPLIFHG